METLVKEYREVLKRLYQRREQLCGRMLDESRRLRVLDEEIEEVEEALLQMRAYLPR